MRAALTLMIVALSIGASLPARAEFPLALQASGGFGAGSGHRDGRSTTGPFGLLAADLEWRQRPGRAIVLSLEGTGGPMGVSTVLDGSRSLSSIQHQSILLGLERSDPGAGVGLYLQGGLGFGRITTSGPRIADGLAIGGTVALRVAPDPGPVGFVLGLRTSHVLAGKASSHVQAVTLGLAIRPR